MLMILRMSGAVSEVHEGYTVIDRDGIGYEVLICGYAFGELTACLGQTVTLHTLEYYEGSSAGGNLIPRLVGFLHPEDRLFFEKFITVKGIGARKSLKALNRPTATVAAAIEEGNAKQLAQLPGIGSRAASQIIAELKGKVANFAIGATTTTATDQSAALSLADEHRMALEVMIALGERRADAERWLERAVQLHPGSRGPDDWVRLAYRVKTGMEG